MGPPGRSPGSHPGKLAGARAVMADPEAFDAAFFNVTPTEAAVMDPQHRVFLETAWAALENAGLNPETSDGLIGVYAGASQIPTSSPTAHPAGTPASFGALQTMLASDKIHAGPGFLQAQPSRTFAQIQTACSTSLVAICVAAQSLLDYHCDVALAGGRLDQLSPEAGWIYEEGASSRRTAIVALLMRRRPEPSRGRRRAVVLKRLSEAEADGDHIWAVLKGCGVNNDGARKVGFTAPVSKARLRSSPWPSGRRRRARVDILRRGPWDGTPLGDPIEFAGLTKAFGPGLPSESCALGSVKTNIGHLDVAAGVAGLIKTVLALHHQQIPRV